MSYAESLSDVERLLTLAVRGGQDDSTRAELGKLYRFLGDAAVRDGARKNYVEALVGAALFDSIGNELAESWRALLADNERRVRRLLSSLQEVLDRLQSAGVQAAVIEGGGTLLASDLPIAAYSAGDFDVLVDAEHWEVSREIVESLGFAAADRRRRPTSRIEYHRRRQDGSEEWIELGCRPFDRMWVPLVYLDRCAIWLARTMPSHKLPAVPVLQPSDAVALAAMHTSLHSFVRAPGLRLYVDIDRMVRDEVIDWQKVVSEVRCMGVQRRAHTSLVIAAYLLRTPVPDFVLEGLVSSTRRSALLLSLLASERVLANGRRKLTGARAVILDALLEQRGIGAWLGSIALPPREWLVEHFDRERSLDATPWRLHLERARLLVTQWRKEVG